jgi:DNA-binding LacI/PurR family transcriptional regulator
MISIRDIAKEAKVSVSTVSRVLNNSGYVQALTRKNVEQAIRKLKYRPSSIARSMVKQQSNIIGLLVPYIHAPFFAGLVGSVEKIANELGYNVILCHTHEDIEKEKKYVNILAERRVDGMIILPVCKEWDHIYEINEVLPVVLTSRRSPDGKISCVRADDFAGSFQVVDHLIEAGYRKIYFISSHSFMMNAIDRMEGAVQALSRAGLDKKKIISAEGDMTFLGGYETTNTLLNQNPLPDAIYTVNQMMALGAAKALKERNLRIPRDVALASFAGFDDYEYDCLIDPKITANIYPSDEIGTTSMKLLYERIVEGSNNKTLSFSPRDIVFKTRLIIRESTKR